jgi:hypothetical protein
MAFFVLGFLLLMGPGFAWAAAVGTWPSELNPTGQTFYGDGATYVNGYLDPPSYNPITGEKCLECHRSGALVALDKSSYLRTGHGNMLKKVSPGQVWRGVTTQPHAATNPYGHVIDWTTGSGRVNLGGSCDVGGFEGQFDQEECETTPACTLAKDDFVSPAYTQTTCEAGGGTWKVGVWTPGDRWADIIYFVGDWLGSASGEYPMVPGYVDTGITGAGLPPNKFMMADGRQYGTCGSCHNAGYAANDYTRPQPFADYPGFPTNANSGVGGSWVLDGIQCERCHDASTHPEDPLGNPASVPANADSTAICSQCHIRKAAWEGSANPNAATQTTAYPIGASATNFGGHLIGKQFLNSPHGLFTGPYAEIATTTDGFYNSSFSPDGVEQGGCDTCHDVHQSVIPDAKTNFGAEPIKPGRNCNDCHTTEAGSSLTIHPTGAGTPFPTGTGTDVPGACVLCHMPKPGGTGLNTHVFRINTNVDYSTFPKQVGGVWIPGYCSDPTYTNRADCVAASKSWSGVAASSPDGTFTEAVWNDLDLACGQCHGADGSAHLMSKGFMAGYAQTMHTGVSAPTTCSDCHSTTTAAHPTGIGMPAQCADCHGTTRAGVRPTVEDGCLGCHGPTGAASHQFTAAQIEPYAGAVHLGGAMPSTTCTDCHTEIPPELINHVNKTCTNCHETDTGARPGVKPTSTEACTDCHVPGGSQSPTALAKRAAKIHKNVAPVASATLTPASGSQVKLGDTVQVVDTSTDPNDNLSMIKVNWGDSVDWKIIEFIDPGETATHSYVVKGTKTITITAYDMLGLKTNVKKKITVVKPVNN